MSAHRYWRVRTTATFGNAAAIGTLEFRDSSSGPNLAGGGTPNSSTLMSGTTSWYWAPNAFDGDSSTYWMASVAVGAWISYDFGSGVAYDIQRVTITSPTGVSNLSFIQSGFVEYSDDNATWTPYFLISGGLQVTTPQIFDYAPLPTANVAITGPSAAVTGFSGAFGVLTSTAGVVTGFGGGSCQVVTSSAVVSAAGGASAFIISPASLLYAQGHESTGEQAADLYAPGPTLAAYSGANAQLTCLPLVLLISATVTGWGAASISAPAPLLSASGTASGMAQAALESPAAGLVGYSGAVCSVTLTGHPAVLASGTTGGVGGADIRGPSPRLVSSGTAQGYGFANLRAPAGHMGATARAWLTAPSPMLTATGHAVVAATYEAYAINLNHTPKPGVEPVDETTRYSRFPFTHIVRHKNSYYGVAADGLYLLEGATDDGVPTPYAVKTATSDFKSPYQKTVASAYLGGRLGPGTTVTLHAGEGAQPQAYPYTTPRGVLAQNYRQVFGKGIRHHRYYAVSISGTDVLEIDNIELDTHQMTRRI